MLRKCFLFVVLTFIIAIPVTDTHATDAGINAGVLMPASKFNHFTNTGYTLGTESRLHVSENLYYGLAINFGAADGSNGVDFWEVDLCPFIDWYIFRRNDFGFFTRGGLGLSHWESDGIWWLDDKGTDVITTIGLGCQMYEKIEILASFTKLYAEFDVDYFQVKVGYVFEIDD